MHVGLGFVTSPSMLKVGVIYRNKRSGHVHGNALRAVTGARPGSPEGKSATARSSAAAFSRAVGGRVRAVVLT